MRAQTGLSWLLDIGTTSISGALADSQGQLVATAQRPNPQQQWGSDIIRRLQAAHEGAAAAIQQALLDALEDLLVVLEQQAAVERQVVTQVVIGANPGICHLFWQWPVERLLRPPYKPYQAGGSWYAAAKHPLSVPAPLYMFPLPAGFVGGDLVAFLYACPSAAPVAFWLDVGTNGEMALFAHGKWWVTSVAAGPAFEGGATAHGMGYEPGAVTDVTTDGDRLQVETVGGMTPRGICGVGLVNAVVLALEQGLVDRHGAIQNPAELDSNLALYIHEAQGQRVLRCYRDAQVDLTISQEDLRQLQLAKGAILAGAQCLLSKAGVAPEDVQQAVITGALGQALPLSALKSIALLPEPMLQNVTFQQQGVLRGLCRFITEPDSSSSVQQLAAVLHPYPLSGTPAFEKAFIQALEF